jgi:hypothetical protein
MIVDYPTMAGGEIGDDLLARSDTAKYRTALRRARNVTILAAGGVTRRPGLLLAGEVYDSTKKHRLLPFQFSVNQGYAMELGEGTLRFVSRGGYVLRKELLIQGITNAAQAQVAATAHGYQVGWDVVFENIEGMVEINGKQARITAVNANNFQVDLDTTTFGIFTGSGGGVLGDAAGGTGGDPAPPPPPAPTDPPPETPPFVDTEDYPPIYFTGGDFHINAP